MRDLECDVKNRGLCGVSGAVPAMVELGEGEIQREREREGNKKEDEKGRFWEDIPR